MSDPATRRPRTESPPYVGRSTLPSGVGARTPEEAVKALQGEPWFPNLKAWHLLVIFGLIAAAMGVIALIGWFPQLMEHAGNTIGGSIPGH